MDSLPTPPSSLSSGKNPWVVKKQYPNVSTTTTTTTTMTTSASKLERFITFLLTCWATMSAQHLPSSHRNSQHSHTNDLNSSASKVIVTRSLLPSMVGQCLDLLLFSSAMIITLFSYISGDLDRKPSSSSSMKSAPSLSLPPPSRHTIMDIKQLRQWQQQQAHDEFHDRLDYTATCPMDDLKHHRIMAWASSQGYQDSSSTTGGSTLLYTPGVPLTTSSLQQNHYRQPHHRLMEEVEDDEKYTFDERWSVDGGGSVSRQQQQEQQAQQKQQQDHLYVPSSSSASNRHGVPSAASSSSSFSSAVHDPEQQQQQQRERDQRLAIMEVQVASLIQQGQAALTKKIKVYELDPNEIALRRALKNRHSR